jgi:hypothetical protein
MNHLSIEVKNFEIIRVINSQLECYYIGSQKIDAF